MQARHTRRRAPFLARVPWSALLAAVLALAASAALVTSEAPIEDPIWWYTNQTPPSVSLEGPAGPLRGVAEGVLVVQPADRTRLVGITVDGQPLATDPPRVVVDTARLADGQHTVTVVVRDTSRRQNQATASWSFVSDNRGPALDVSLDPAGGPVEGHTLVIRIRPSEPGPSPIGDLEGRKLLLQPDGAGGYWALEGIPPGVSYQQMSLRVRATDALGNETTWSHTYPVKRTRFPEETLDFDPSLDYLANKEVRAEEDARLHAVYAAPSGPARWSGPFQLPVEGPITTQFATKRSYNGRFPEGHHAGVDFGAPMGAAVLAPADGVVRFAEKVPVRGNALVLDHGAGVFSTYAHLQRFEVQVGDVVKAGQLIARVDSTGLSTGPHLHWEIWVDGANVDPLDWTKRTFP